MEVNRFELFANAFRERMESDKKEKAEQEEREQLVADIPIARLRQIIKADEDGRLYIMHE